MLTPRDQLLASHEEFRKLAMEHTQYAERLIGSMVHMRRSLVTGVVL